MLGVASTRPPMCRRIHAPTQLHPDAPTNVSTHGTDGCIDRCSPQLLPRLCQQQHLRLHRLALRQIRGRQHPWPTPDPHELTNPANTSMSADGSMHTKASQISVSFAASESQGRPLFSCCTAAQAGMRASACSAFSCFQLPMLAPERALSFVQHVAYYLVRAGVVVALH